MALVSKNFHGACTNVIELTTLHTIYNSSILFEYGGRSIAPHYYNATHSSDILLLKNARDSSG